MILAVIAFCANSCWEVTGSSAAEKKLDNIVFASLKEKFKLNLKNDKKEKKDKIKNLETGLLSGKKKKTKVYDWVRFKRDFFEYSPWTMVNIARIGVFISAYCYHSG